MKCCRKCKQTLALNLFHRDASTRDGLFRYCKPCTLQMQRGYRAASIESHGPRVKDKAKNRSRAAAHHALKMGRLYREPCFVCGSEAEMHHVAYSSPLLVTWLCASHHRQLHIEHERSMSGEGLTT